jgi:hypothetical protein
MVSRLGWLLFEHAIELAERLPQQHRNVDGPENIGIGPLLPRILYLLLVI